MQGKSEQTGSTGSLGTVGDRYYQMVFIWMKDPVTFSRYVDLLRPVVRPYGGGFERTFVPDSIYAEGMRKPDAVNIVFYDSRDAYAAFEKDPEFATIVPLRAASIDMASVAGTPDGVAVTHQDVESRLYLVEVARFGPQGAQGYRQYEEQADAVMRRYGYHVERRLTPDAASGFPFQPDLVKVAYFDSPDGMERFHQDAAHHRIKHELYPAAVQQSVWVVGRVRSTTLDGKPHG